jgi:hypothetical protein
MATLSAATKTGVLDRSDCGSSVGQWWKHGPRWEFSSTGRSREAALNWLALGMLLAAWNVSNDDPTSRAQPRPVSLRGYAFVSVRAASLHATQPGSAPMN